MKIYDAIRGRRSIRQYTSAAPAATKIKKILEAGTWAPSGLNNQPWKFKVLKEKKLKDGLAEFTSSGTVIKSAPIAICVFLDKKAMYNREKDTMAIGACIQNMLLEARELGLEACWLGEILNKRRAAEKYIGAGPRYELMAVVAAGYSDRKAAGSRKKLESFIL